MRLPIGKSENEELGRGNATLSTFHDETRPKRKSITNYLQKVGTSQIFVMQM
jgi:hypothetical protein